MTIITLFIIVTTVNAKFKFFNCTNYINQTVEWFRYNQSVLTLVTGSGAILLSDQHLRNLTVLVVIASYPETLANQRNVESKVRVKLLTTTTQFL